MAIGRNGAALFARPGDYVGDPTMADVNECVINISEGRDADLVDRIAAGAGPYLLDVHRDRDHNRSVLTVAGPEEEVQNAARRVAAASVATLDLAGHQGAHPRIGVVDVVPFVALEGWPLRPGDPATALRQRDAFARWAASELGLPCFLYGPERSLPEVRRSAWTALLPDYFPPAAGLGGSGSATPHPTAGAAAVGARPPLVAYNLWLTAGTGLPTARRIAAELRGVSLRTLGLQVGDDVQVSCNLVAPWHLGPGAAHDAVATKAAAEHAGVVRGELVGLIPRSVLEAEPARRWTELGIDEAATIEARLEEADLV